MRLKPDLSILPLPQRQLWPKLAKLPQHFVLYGGTAVALRFGHRTSLASISSRTALFDPFELRSPLDELGEGEIL